jgi:hypothetical protein
VNINRQGELFSPILKCALTVVAIAAVATTAPAQTNTFPSSGNVGIGTTTPNGGTVQVQSTTADNHVYVSSTAPDVVFGNNATRSAATKIGFIGLATATGHFFASAAAGDLAAGTGAGGGRFMLGTAGTTALTIDTSQKIGIGTTAPNQALTVGGWTQSGFGYTAQFFSGNTTTPTNQLNITDVKDTWGLILGSNGASVAQTGYHGPNWAHVINVENAPLSLGANNTAVLNLASAGNPAAYCGTALLNNSNAWGGTAAYYPLLGSTGCSGGVQGLIMLSAPHIPYSAGGSGAFTRMADSAAASNYWDAGLLGDQYMIRRNAGSAFMTVTNGGNVGIGTAAPASKLDVAGEIRSSSGGFRFPDGTLQTTAASGSGGSGSQWTTAGANIYYNDGNVGIGTPTPGTRLHVSAGDSSFALFGPNTSWGGSLAVGSGGGSFLMPISGRAQVLSSNGNLHLDGGATQMVYIAWLNTSNTIINGQGGNVGIGTSTPTKKLDVSGDMNASGTITAGNIVAKYQDLAEWVPSATHLAPSTVVVLDTNKSNQVISSSQAYDTRVAGVISAQPGITLGESGEGKVLVATTGRVRVKVDASRGPIQIGDLLVTSGTPGVAMKSEPVNLGGVQIHRPGTIIGKALEPLSKGQGEILVLLSLQ